MRDRRWIILVFVFLCNVVIAHEDENFNWWNPAQNNFPVIEGRASAGAVANPYDRFPAKMQPLVREVLWSKSQQSTGLIIKFRTNAASVHVRYKVNGERAFEHMPATGVSGLDLYALNQNGSWEWTGATYIFADTIRYFYDALSPDGEREYNLYLPLYNKVEWLEIGVPQQASFTPIPLKTEKPLVVYGTSIAQGGCASRPGMAWTAILGRRTKMPMVNLGFSSNGLLEKPVVDLLLEVDAAVYILDCLPNLVLSLPAEEIKKRLLETVRTIRKQKPGIPIVLTEHADANINVMNTRDDHMFKQVNQLGYTTFKELKAEGIKGLYFLSAKKIGLNNESTVDGSHPNDQGMERYANAYERLIRKILKR